MSNLICGWMGIGENSQEGKLELIRQETIAAIAEEQAVIFFTSGKCSPVAHSEWQEDVVLIGEEISDYEETMVEFFEMCA